jgi:hypothetical protein
MAQRAGLVPVGSWINDFKRMQGGVADVAEQHRKAEQDEQHTSPSIDVANGPRRLPPAPKRIMRSQAVSQSYALRVGRRIHSILMMKLQLGSVNGST